MSHRKRNSLFSKPLRSSLFRREDVAAEVASMPSSPSPSPSLSVVRKDSISLPFNFEHISHTERFNLPLLGSVRGRVLTEAFFAASMRPRPRKPLAGMRVDDVPEKLSAMGVARGASRSHPESAATATYPPVSLPVWLDSRSDLPLQPPPKADKDKSCSSSLLASTIIYTSPLKSPAMSDSWQSDWPIDWEHDVDYCYAQEAESTCDFDWSRPEKQPSRTPSVSSQNHAPLGHAGVLATRGAPGPTPYDISSASLSIPVASKPVFTPPNYGATSFATSAQREIEAPAAAAITATDGVDASPETSSSSRRISKSSLRNMLSRSPEASRDSYQERPRRSSTAAPRFLRSKRRQQQQQQARTEPAWF
ncbi:hypothetical protein K470DRAFT_256529 [Piedraia hortae CBS 480.64]|uniref:CRIB domain-containing protein n=1 Tax=Piedraia hortae CBS 480.64 TaxID=1314780 RepID=A0A6A7C3Q0_9PEZI|nr:hypothetical protein K470DRAFT_256529 [Piedraia hortae CBS 480.64]